MPKIKLVISALSLALLFSLPGALPAQEDPKPAAEAAPEAKPEEPKPATEAKPEETKPEAKPAEDPKPAEEKKPETPTPAEPKPADEPKPATEPKPEEPKPETKPADAPADKPGPVTPEKVEGAPKAVELIEHLDNPSGLALQPETNQVFVASKQGIFRLIPGKPHKIYLEVEGFPTDVYGKGPKYNIGPLGLAFWGKDRLVVGDGSRVDGEEVVRVYKIGEKAPAPPAKEDKAEFTLGPIAPGDASPKGEGNYYGVLALNNAIYATANGNDAKGWVAKAEVADGKPGELKPWLATKEALEIDAPIAITATPDGKELLISQGGEVNVPGDSLLAFYDPADGKLLRKYKTGLHDITGVAYAPNGKLYVTDFAWADLNQGGLFEVTFEGEEVKTKKIVGLDRPTAVVFDKDGNAYVTVFGIGRDTEDKPNGGLLKFSAGF